MELTDSIRSKVHYAIGWNKGSLQPFIGKEGYFGNTEDMLLDQIKCDNTYTLDDIDMWNEGSRPYKLKNDDMVFPWFWFFIPKEYIIKERKESKVALTDRTEAYIRNLIKFDPGSFLQYVGEDCYVHDTVEGLIGCIRHDGSPNKLEAIEILNPNGPFKTEKVHWRYCVPKSCLDHLYDVRYKDLTFGARYGMGPSAVNFSNFLNEVKEKNMNNTVKIAKEQGLNAIAVNYWDDMTERFEGKDYTYLVKGEYKEGDFPVFRNYNGSITTVKVVKVIKNEDLETLDQNLNYKIMEVLGTADMKPYNEKVAAEEKERRKEEIMEELDEKFADANKMSMYRKLAENDKEMAALLKELDSLDK